MLNRALAAAVLVPVFVGLMLANDAAARSGGHPGGRSAARPLVRVQPVLPRRVTRSVQVARPQARMFHRGFRPVRDHAFAFRAPGFAYYDNPVPEQGPIIRQVPPGEPVTLNGRPCFVQRYIVPSEAGDSRPVSVARCY